jgi:hypothetical protein
VFHHRRWIELILEQYGGDCLIPAVRRDGTITTAIPFLEVRGISARRRLISLRFSDCVPVLTWADDPADDVRACAASLLERGYRSIVVRSERPLGDAPYSTECVRHVLNLDRPLAELQAGFESRLRRNLRKAAASGLSFEFRTDAAAMEEFYRLHVMTRRKLGLPVQPKRFLMRLQAVMMEEGLGFTGVVKREHRPIAAGVFLLFGKTMIYKYGASDPHALEHRPNEFLMENAIRHGVEMNCTAFDFGVTARTNEGLRRFKSKWGAVEEDAYDVYLAGAPRRRSANSRLVKLASTAIRRSPPLVCRLLGEAFYRFSQ